VSLGKNKLAEALKNNICGTTQRSLVPGTLKVYPMKGYGALQIGVHRFYHPKEGKKDIPGEGQFIHLWQYKDGGWKITRVISFDHHSTKK
ncbi:MAG: nuclear transport factor 2 family protein, partial [Acidobacteria bacterium]|nr:nuclear transport factor 2 family protein [Acidobacteriota bacterium]